jgi:hypothetical protein
MSQAGSAQLYFAERRLGEPLASEHRAPWQVSIRLDRDEAPWLCVVRAGSAASLELDEVEVAVFREMDAPFWVVAARSIDPESQITVALDGVAVEVLASRHAWFAVLSTRGGSHRVETRELGADHSRRRSLMLKSDAKLRQLAEEATARCLKS